jgi:hypothetical protein
MSVERVALNLKVRPVTKARAVVCAEADFRTVSAYVEALVEADAKVRKIEIDESLFMTKSAKEKKEVPIFDPLAMELPECIDEDVWEEWIDYRKERGYPIDERTLRHQLKVAIKGYEEGYNVNSAINRAIASGKWRMFFFDKRDLDDEPEETPCQKLTREWEYSKTGRSL